MILPSYDKSRRKKSFEQLPKAAYVVKIVNAKVAQNRTGSSRLDIAFDIAEGEYKGFYKQQYDANQNEEKKWPNDAIFRLMIPVEGAAQFVWDNWNTFFADLEDSNAGFVFDGDTKSLKGKLIGGKFHIEQTEFNGNIYSHTRMKWTCVADDVRKGKSGRLPNDKLVESLTIRSTANNMIDADGFMVIQDNEDEEILFE